MAGVFLQTIFDEVRQALDAGDTERAIAIAQHILQHAPTVIEAQRLLGEAYLNAGQFEPASEAFKAVLRADPEHIAAYYGLGLAQRNLHQTADALRSLERALEIQPNLAELRTQLLHLYAETPHSAGQFRLSRSGLGRLYARGQMYTQAIDEFRAVLDNEPDRDDVRVALAEALWRDGQEDAAIEWSRLVVESRPELFKPTLILGYLQLAAGHPEGEALWRRAAAQEPTLTTAEALFDVLPPIPLDEPMIPAFDEEAWRSAAAQAAVVEPEPAPAVAGALPAAAPTTISQSDDDFLASLLGFDIDADEMPSDTAAAVAPDAPAQGDDVSSESVAQAAQDVAAESVQGRDDVPQDVIDGSVDDDAATGSATVRLDDADLPGVDVQPFPMFGRRTSGAASFGRVEPFRLDDWEDALTAGEPAPPANTDTVSPHADTDAAQSVAEMPVSAPQRGEMPTNTDTSVADGPTSAHRGTASSAAEPPTRTDSSAFEAQTDAMPGETAPVPDEPAAKPVLPPATAAPDDRFSGIKPFSLTDLDAPGESREDMPAGRQSGADEESQSFSLRELGLAAHDNADDIPVAPPSEYGEDDDVPQATTDDAALSSRGDLGLTDDELARWERQGPTGEEPWNEASFYGSEAAEREALTPFSLTDLGLTDEDLRRWSTDSPTPPTGTTVGGEDDITPFSLADFEPPAPAAPQQRDQPPSIHTVETQPFDVSALLGDEAPQPGDVETPEDVALGDDAPPPETPTLRRFHQQLATDPENAGLRLAIARASAQQNNVEQAIEQYKQLLRRGALLDAIVDDLRDLIEATEDRTMLRKLHRLLGDVYMKQDRIDEALVEYSWA